MALGGDYEDGEIVEEGEEIAQLSSSLQPVASVRSSSFLSADTLTVPYPHVQPPNEPLLPTPSTNPRKRLHSSLQDARAADLTSVYSRRTPLSHHQPSRFNYSSNNDHRRDAVPHKNQDDRVYAEDLIVQYPRQQPRSNVLLHFAVWMAAARSRTRLNVEDVQKLVLNVLGEDNEKDKDVVSPYLLPFLMPGAELPTKICLVLVKKMHPSVLQKYRAKLSFFNGCSSVPILLTKEEVNQIRRSEEPLPELMYKFPRPTVETHELSMDELFYAHELTFLMKHSAGFTDELILSPTGTFTRKAQPLGGTWELDGDLLHLKWRQSKTKVADKMTTVQDAVMEKKEAVAYTLDVLVSQDASMHEFRTDPVTDKTYAHKVPEHLAKKRREDDKPRSIWLSLAKAVAIDAPRSADGMLILHDQVQTNDLSKYQHDISSANAIGYDTRGEKELRREAFEYYVLSPEELKQHGYPTDVEEEQHQLLATTSGNTRDIYVATKPRPSVEVESPASALDDDDEEEGTTMETDETMPNAASDANFVYALDCEMCETDIGMELTRVTVVNIKGAVVYDQLVKPQSTIINYHTEFSGISEETLQDTKHVLADVQRDLITQFLFEDTILVGHSLTSDLRALRVVHPTIVDTAILFPHQRGFPFRPSLKYLTKTYLKKDIQMQVQTGHDSAEDAIAALDLLLLKVREGPWFGIPDAVSSSGAFDSIVDKVFALGKTMTMLRLQSMASPEDGSSVALAPKRKPWDLYASGDLKAHSQSPFRHAQAKMSKAKASSLASSTSAVASASANVKAEECLSWETLKTSLHDILGAKTNEATEQPDLCWVEVEPPSASAARCNDFVSKHERWMAEQEHYSEQVNAFLQQVCDEVLPKGTLLLALPQGDLSLLRYLKGLRTRSKWRDAAHGCDDLAPDELHAAVGDAFCGAMDSCLFLMQKL